jgi:hypothetical protein
MVCVVCCRSVDSKVLDAGGGLFAAAGADSVPLGASLQAQVENATTT